MGNVRGLSILLLVSLATILATSHRSSGLSIPTLIRQPVVAASGEGESVLRYSCRSWRFGVETNNIRSFGLVPKVCGYYVKNYITGPAYLEDSKAVNDEASKYVNGLNLIGDGKDLWVFDVDETLLSHVKFFAQYGYGTEPYDIWDLIEFMLEGISTALPESLKFYNKLVDLGVKVVFLTGRGEFLREATEANLKNVGYHTWHELILRGPADTNTTQLEYKSAARTRLVESGFRIIGNMGDQWSDLLGDHPGDRTFKLPNPMYYAS